MHIKSACRVPCRASASRGARISWSSMRWVTRGQEEARVEQAADFVDVDVWDHAVESWMRSNAITSSSRLVLSSVLSEAIKMPLAQQDRRAQLRLAALLTRMGWVAKTVREGGATRRCWVREAPK